jgi:hypothetical protein
MAPISLNPLLGYTPNKVPFTTPDTDIQTYLGGDVPLTFNKPDDAASLRNKYWVINQGLIDYTLSDDMYHMTVNYDYISADGTTPTMGSANNWTSGDPYPGGTGSLSGTNLLNPLDYLIAPMQMFLVQSSGAFKLSLKPALRTLGHNTRFLKSVQTNNNLMSDFFVVEVANPVDKLSDRTAVVLRESAMMTNADAYDTSKNLSKSIVLPSEKDKTYPNESSSYIYTKSSEGSKMLGNAVPLNVKELALYVTPPSTQQQMKLNFYNLENMTTVPNVWLIDRYENNKTVKLTPGYTYEYTSGPSDLKAVDENRFILRFYATDDIISNEENSVNCYYNTSVLHISGLNENDIDSSIQIFDMQGRLMGKTKVNYYPSMEYVKPLSMGTYIVKITGKRNFTTKFVNLQN